MICKKCQKNKLKKDMYFDHTGLWETCNDCVRVLKNQKLAIKKAARRSFVEKFNKLVGASKCK